MAIGVTSIEDNPLYPILEDGIESLGRFYSIYRAYVIDNLDPLNQNRLAVLIPEVGNLELWAIPRNQHGSNGNGFRYLPPKVGDVVWITFEKGNPQMPLWEFHSWADDEAPEGFRDPNVFGLVTPEGLSILINDTNKEDNLGVYIPGDAYIVSEQDIHISGRLVEFNRGDNGGMVKIKELTDKLNNLVKELEQLKQDYQQHTHSGVTTGGGTSGTVVKPYTKNFTQFNQSDYEDLNCTH